jgi:hypothetical protein
VKYRFYEHGGKRLCELEAYPAGAIAYTVDGSSPETSGQPYTGPFEVPADARVLQARAREDGVASQTLNVPVTSGKAKEFQVDLNKPAVWKKRQSRDATGDSYQFLELAGKYQAALGGVALLLAKEHHWIELRADDDSWQLPDAVRDHAAMLAQVVPGGNVTLELSQLRFERGQDLSDFAADLREALTASEVEQ